MGNPLLGQILAAAVGSRLNTNRGGMPAQGGNFGGMGGMGGMGGLGGGVGTIALGSLLGRLAGGRGARPSNNRGMLLALMLPLAMRWVQQHGGLGAVLDRFRQGGLAGKANSWLQPGENQPVSAQEVQQVVGSDTIARFASQLGVPEQQVSEAFAEIMPELADKLTPDGTIEPHTDAALDGGRDELEKVLGELHADTQQLS